MTSNSRNDRAKQIKSAYAEATANSVVTNSWTTDLTHIENSNIREDAERLSRQISDINAGRAWANRI